MEKRVLSFRVSEAEITALEALQHPEDSSLGQTALRLLRSLIGVQTDTPVNAVDTDGIKDRVESLEERLTDAIISREQLSDFVNDIVDKRIQHLADVLSDHENRLLGIEQAQEKLSHPPVKPEATTQEVALALLQDKEDAIASGKTITDRPSCPYCGTNEKVSSKIKEKGKWICKNKEGHEDKKVKYFTFKQ